MEELKDIIIQMKKIRTETTTKVSDELLWDTAVRVFNSKQNLKQRQGGNNKTLITPNSSYPLASDKQKKLLRQLKVKFDDNLTKKEATKLIEEHLKK